MNKEVIFDKFKESCPWRRKSKVPSPSDYYFCAAYDENGNFKVDCDNYKNCAPFYWITVLERGLVDQLWKEVPSIFHDCGVK